MGRAWSFGRKISLGFSVIVMLTVLTSLVATYALRSVVATMDRTISIFASDLILAETLRAAAETEAATSRGFLLDRDQSSLEGMREARAEFAMVLQRLRKQVPTEEGRELLEEIARKDATRRADLDHAIALRQSDESLDVVARALQERVLPRRRELRDAIAAFTTREERLLKEEQRTASEAVSFAVTLVVVVALLSVGMGIALALLLTRTLKRQIGSAVQHIQSSSTELQSAATQQAAGSKEQATAMNEITVTVQELLTTAKQIAESARRVAKIAEDTAAAAQAGDLTVQRAQDAVAGIRRQVDLIVSHMMDLGKKSQQIGGILEIINELAEQTNILAINATIEAAGAGEVGKRFGAVAEEIRKLADRVGMSTKEIRTLIEEIRAAVHTTIMATETGSKTVEAGTKQFGEVASAFKQIVTMVGTTTEAAREIELSTKQQSSAVEQVNVATTNVAQAAKESEASSLQTVQTASDLAKLSHDLALLVQPQGRV